jgi:hypothetical protein
MINNYFVVMPDVFLNWDGAFLRCSFFLVRLKKIDFFWFIVYARFFVNNEKQILLLYVIFNLDVNQLI